MYDSEQGAGAPGRGQGRITRANPGRVAAAKALVQVEEGDHVEDVLAFAAPEAPEDRRLAWHLALGVLRARGRVDAALRGVVHRPLQELDAPVRAVLRIGAFELLIGGTARHAAVDQAVEVVRALNSGRASSFVNAALRRVEPAVTLSTAEALDHPAWLLARWEARYGADVARAWCRRNGDPPPLVLAATHDVATLAAQLAEAGVSTGPAIAGGEVVPGLLRVIGERVGRVEQLPGFQDGAMWVQDAASAWIADLVPASGARVIDACAAPGGKTFRLVSRGANVMSVDASTRRLGRLRDSLARLKMRAEVRVHDWTRGPIPGLGQVDAVLVDAPCTGLGVARRHPEIRWRRGPLDPGRAGADQLPILKAAAWHVKPGGTLVYAVCSPEPEEGAQVIERFIEAHEEFTVIETRATAPCLDDEDAFFGVRLVRG